MNYHHFYDVQFVFDQDSIKALGNQGGNNNPKVIVDPKNLVDGQYDITFKVLKDKTDEISKMNDYVVNPAKLIVKDGKNILR